MRLRRQHYGFYAVTAMCLAVASLFSTQGLAQSADNGGKAELAAQSDKNPHQWGQLSGSEVRRSPSQSAKNPHEWGLPSSSLSSAPAAQSDKNPHAWGVVPSTRAAQAIVGDR